MSAWPSADNRPTATMPADSSSDAARLRELGYEPELARRLSVRDLVINGLIYMVPRWRRSASSGSSTTCRPGR